MKWICPECKAINPEFSYKCHNCGHRPEMLVKEPSIPIIKQGKWECASATLAMLLGHTHFMVKSAMGAHGWRNDQSGAGDRVLRAAAREFGRDLVWCSKRLIYAVEEQLPDALLTVPSLNYKGAYHGVAWINKEVVDPNFGRTDRKYWWANATFENMNVSSCLIVADRPLPDSAHKKLRRMYQQKLSVKEILVETLTMAG